MFTLGDKQRVLNANADVTVRDASNSLVTASGDVLASDTINVEGYGSILISAIKEMKLRRYSAATAESKDYTVVAPAGLSVGEAVEVSIFAKTGRYQSELKNNFISAVRPITFMTAPLTGVTAANIVTAIATAWVDRGFAFHNETPVISVGAGSDAADIEVAAAAGYESVTIERVEIKRAAQGIGSPAPVVLGVNVVNAVGSEGHGTGKFLEESIRMATDLNNDPYGSDVMDTRVDLRGGYTEVSMVIDSPYYENLSTMAAGHGPLPAQHRLTLWLNEGTTIAANAAVSMFAAAGVIAAGANAGMTLTDQTATNGILTNAQEGTETLRLANGNSVDDVAAFIA